MNPTPGMSEESARNTVKRHEFDTGQRPKPDLRDYDYAKGYLARVEQVDHGKFELAKANEASIRRDLVKVEVALESSRQEIERLKHERDMALRMAENKNPQIDILRQHNLKLNKELEAERQSTEKLVEILEMYQKAVDDRQVITKIFHCYQNGKEALSRHKAGGKAT